MGLDTGSLIKTLNKACLDALQGAAGLCLSKTNFTVELEHWLLKLVELPDGDLTRLFRQFDLDPSRVQRDLSRAIDGLKTGNSRTPTLSPQVDHLIREAWVLASIQFREPKVRSGLLLMALLSDERLGRQAREMSKEFARIPIEPLWKDLPKIVDGSSEDAGPAAATAAGEPASAAPGRA